MSCKSLPINHNAFSEYSHEAAYWAGFLASDGNISQSKTGKNSRVRLYLSSIDEPHLQKFKRFLQSEHKVALSEKYDRCSFEFSSEQICQDLLDKYNITPRKSMTYEYPTIPLEFEADFLRGLFDGDGCICESFTCKNSLTASLNIYIMGTKSVADGVMNFAKKALAEESPGYFSTHVNGETAFAHFATRNGGKLCTIMYLNSTENSRLDRKYSIYKRVFLDGVRKTRELPPYEQRVVTKTSRRRVKKTLVDDGIVQTAAKATDITAYMDLLSRVSQPRSTNL